MAKLISHVHQSLASAYSPRALPSATLIQCVVCPVPIPIARQAYPASVSSYLPSAPLHPCFSPLPISHIDPACPSGKRACATGRNSYIFEHCNTVQKSCSSVKRVRSAASGRGGELSPSRITYKLFAIVSRIVGFGLVIAQ